MKFILENIGEKFHRLYPNFLVEKISFDVMSSPYILMTCHRRENIGENLIRICEAVLGVSTKFPNIHIILPMHLNPTVRSTILSILGEQKNICLLEPIDYIPFIYLMSHASIIITDSGGIQEEAPSLGKPVLLLRDSTERPEVVSTGAVELVGADKERIISRVSELLLGENSSVDVNTAKINPYGDGCTAEKILSILKENMHV
jgi:UDP-N-acetylglucosamine 2-epimerase (non-hydrolysing)